VDAVCGISSIKLGSDAANYETNYFFGRTGVHLAEGEAISCAIFATGNLPEHVAARQCRCGAIVTLNEEL
jgi:hypothetical protein